MTDITIALPSPTAAPPRPAGTTSLAIALAILAMLLGLIMLAFAQHPLPTPQPVSAPAKQFSAARAFAQLEGIARQPHFMGSTQQFKVEANIVQTLQSLGLTPQIQAGLAVDDTERFFAAGKVRNIVARLPGSGGGKALMLVAHYDSVHTGPGAADDGASVAAILETLRALKQGPALQRDVIALFTDGEEAGLLGSKLFVQQHPWVKDVGVVLNFEYRGSDGPVLMFETSAGNGKLIKAMTQLSSTPVSNSLMYEIYRFLDNDTDMTSFKNGQGGQMAGMNFAAIEEASTYHMQLDTIEALNPATVQHQGDIMLALTRQLGNGSLDNLQSGDAIYFELPGLGFIHYPASLAPLFSGLILLLLVGTLLIGARASRYRLGRALLATLVFALSTVLVAIACQMLWKLMGRIEPQLRVMIFPYNSHWYLPAFALFATCGLLACQRLVARWFSSSELAVGATLLWSILLLLCTIYVPGASYLFTWPLLSLLLLQAWLWTARGATLSSNAQAAAWLLAAIPGLLLYAPVVRMVFLGFTPQLPALTGLIVMLFLGLLLPLINLLRQRYVLPLLPALACVGFLMLGAVQSRFNVEQPKPSVLYYALDGDAGKAYWISRDKVLNAWEKPYFKGAKAIGEMPAAFGKQSYKVWVDQAQVLPGITAPAVEILQDRVQAGERHIHLRVRSKRAAPTITVDVDGVTVQQASVAGQPYTRSPNAQWTVSGYAMNEQWLDLELRVKPGTPFAIRVTDISYGLEQVGVPARPAGEMPAQDGLNADTVQATTVHKMS